MDRITAKQLERTIEQLTEMKEELEDLEKDIAEGYLDEDDEEMERFKYKTNTYFCSSHYIAYPSRGFIDID